jgi:uncharacterized protein (DUF433 family)
MKEHQTMAHDQLPHTDRITHDPQIMVGKPVIVGTRIPVERVLAHLAHNPDLDDLFGAYPELTLEDVKASLQYAYVAVEGNHKRTRRRLSGPVGASQG